jgi:cyclopropane fatty-acyl-phospholipid synthase-like methyltransferase
MLPLSALAPEFELLRGRALSLGCGSAVVERFAAELNNELTIDGIDHDDRRLAIAERTSARAPRVHVEQARIEELETDRGPYDAIVAVDIIHHLSDATVDALAPKTRDLLTPSGVLLIKDIGEKPAWKAAVNHLQDRIVAGPGSVAARSPEDAAVPFEKAGFTIERIARADRFRPHPHYILRLLRTS